MIYYPLSALMLAGNPRHTGDLRSTGPTGVLIAAEGRKQSRHAAAQFFETVEQRQGLMIGCLKEIALRMDFIDLAAFEALAKRREKSQYGIYLTRIVHEFKQR